jgi:hypothetical protein
MVTMKDDFSQEFKNKSIEIIKESIHKLNQMPKEILHSIASQHLGYQSTSFTEDAMKTGRCSNPNRVFDFMIQILTQDLTNIAKTTVSPQIHSADLQTQVKILIKPFEFIALSEPNCCTLYHYANKAWADALSADYYYAFEKDWGED